MTEATIAEAGEFGLIDRIITATKGKAVLLGPGDDAAVIAAPSGSVVATVDLLVEGRHFKRAWSTPIEIGKKAAAASLADIAAMGAKPTALLVGFAAPGETTANWALACAAAIAEEAASAGAVVVGGDVTAADVIMLSITALGDLDGREPVTRTGARPGDVLALAGRTGWSAAGMAVLARGFRSPKLLVDAHRAPEPPYAAGVAAAKGGATSMIDVSDGLVADARHIAQASGVVLAIETSALDIPEEMRATAAAYNLDPLVWALTGGEDHAMLATFPPKKKLPKGFVRIGEVTAIEGDSAPDVLVDGVPYAGAGGHEHFREK